MTPEQHAEQRIRDAEVSRAMVFLPTGKGSDRALQKHSNNQFVFTAMMDEDEDYITVGSHVDEFTIGKIRRSEYIDFGKLIPRDQILVAEDSRLELVVKGGQTYYVPVNKTTEITNFNKWEQAFRVFANIYTKYYPHQSSELIEYNHVIHTISMVYPWDNIYLYDKDFRLHIGKHPDHNWSIILQQAWLLRLREKTQSVMSSNGNVNHGSGLGNHSTLHKADEPGRWYNRGRCPFRSGCKYDHRCTYCFKMGHSVLNCHKLAADKDQECSRYNNHRKHRDIQQEDQSDFRKHTHGLQNGGNKRK